MIHEYVIEVVNSPGLSDFIVGGTYNIGGNKYAKLSNLLSRAKHYRSESRAVLAGKRFERKCCNVEEYRVMRVFASLDDN